MTVRCLCRDLAGGEGRRKESLTPVLLEVRDGAGWVAFAGWSFRHLSRTDLCFRRMRRMVEADCHSAPVSSHCSGLLKSIVIRVVQYGKKLCRTVACSRKRQCARSRLAKVHLCSTESRGRFRVELSDSSTRGSELRSVGTTVFMRSTYFRLGGRKGDTCEAPFGGSDALTCSRRDFAASRKSLPVRTGTLVAESHTETLRAVSGMLSVRGVSCASSCSSVRSSSWAGCG
mmetsp:Transcript_43771/g.78206  ORF Transcript_43771/g.78206 Transcript_43771/m.78206 type:complete len:230 (+) Transcript_43771:1673-2362(+)